MGDHLQFDEMLELIYSINSDTNNVLAAKVNSHLTQCNQCFEHYDVLLALCEQIELVPIGLGPILNQG